MTHRMLHRRPGDHQDIRPLGVLAALVVASVIASPPVAAAPIFELDHFIDVFNSTVHAPGGDIGPQGTPIDYDFPFQSVQFQNKNFAEVYANVDPGSIGIFDRAWNNGQYAPQRQEVYGNFKFDVIFTSPSNNPIDVIMNLDISGEVLEGDSLYSGVNIAAGATGITPAYSGSYHEVNDGVSPPVIRNSSTP